MPFSKPPALPVRLGKALPLQREFVNVHVYVLVLVNEGKRIRGSAGFLQNAGDNRCQAPVKEGKVLLTRVVAMGTKMCRSAE